MAGDAEDTVRRRVTLGVSAERAFAVFTESAASWWPHDYTWGKDVLEALCIEPREGGRWFERGPHGFHCDWGRVLACEPPHRLVLSWQVSPTGTPEPNPAKASEVEVRFVSVGPTATEVQLEHRCFARHGEEGPSYRARMDSPAAWTLILDRYVAAASARP